MSTPIEEYVDPIYTALKDSPTWGPRLKSAIDEGSITSLKNWLSGHSRVSTLQFTVEGEKVTLTFSPGVRDVDQSHSTYVSFDGSIRDYAGVVCLASDDSTWIGLDKSDDTVCIHHAEA